MVNRFWLPLIPSAPTIFLVLVIVLSPPYEFMLIPLLAPKIVPSLVRVVAPLLAIPQWPAVIVPVLVLLSVLEL